MNILVLNGSPKGLTSVTMQYVKYLQKVFVDHDFTIENIAQRITAIETDEGEFNRILEGVRSRDGVLWAFPLYYGLVHSHYKRFIELIHERGAGEAFRGIYTAGFSTSIHFFDHTAHNYLHGICDDLGMLFVGSYSAEMNDLLKREERQQFRCFAEDFFQAIETSRPTARCYEPVTNHVPRYEPGVATGRIESRGKRIVVVTDRRDEGSNLEGMVERFRGAFRAPPELICLADLEIKGGCLGCIQCGLDNICAYEGKDDYIEFFRTKIKPADIVVFAGTVTDRYLSSRWKLFFDRSFFNTHIPTMTDKQAAWLISGPLGAVGNLRELLEGYAQLGEGHLVEIITDEVGDSGRLDGLLDNLARRLVYFADNHYRPPHNFLGVGGRKLFRDEIWGRLRYVFQADHRYYKAQGFYDFPQKDLGQRMRNRLMFLLTKIPAFRRAFVRRIRGEMIKPYEKFLGALPGAENEGHSK